MQMIFDPLVKIMPRIDPIQLLNCLSVLLSPEGGIKSREEVQRLAKLMTKYSKKLVSKCIYIQILKYTETDLLGLFMGSEGWLLVHMWLTESIVAKNWPLVKELLELLLLCPVDIERLKTNNCPKLVKELSKDEDHLAIRALASKLVEQWLKTVKGEQVIPVRRSDLPQIISDAQPDAEINIKTECDVANNINSNIHSVEDKVIDEVQVKIENSKDVDTVEQGTVADEKVDVKPEILPVLKISLKDVKEEISDVNEDNESKTSETSESEKPKEKSSSTKDKTEDGSRSSKSSSSSKHSSRSHSSSDKHKRSSSHRSSSSHHSSSKEKLKDKSKDKHSSSSSKAKSDSRKSSDKQSSSSSSSSRSKDDRSSRSADKDKTKDKIKDDKKDKSNNSTEKLDDKTPSIHKLGKIPKLNDVKKEKPSISIEIRKPDEPKPKTVKTFHSKFRKHGLEEEVKPPPSRAAVLTKKVTAVVPPIIQIPKRPSPVHSDPPPEKKSKIIEPIEKPGAIKLIPPKPKRKYCFIHGILTILLIFFSFPDRWRQVLLFISTSVYNSLSSHYCCGKSKMHNLTGSKIILLPVTYFFK